VLWRAAVAAFGDAQKAERFLFAPHPMLSMRTPVECAVASDAGLKEITGLLARLVRGTAP
jgi:uncharacterized protein (DUF2384 family)